MVDVELFSSGGSSNAINMSMFPPDHFMRNICMLTRARTHAHTRRQRHRQRKVSEQREHHTGVEVSETRVSVHELTRLSNCCMLRAHGVSGVRCVCVCVILYARNWHTHFSVRVCLFVCTEAVYFCNRVFTCTGRLHTCEPRTLLLYTNRTRTARKHTPPDNTTTSLTGPLAALLPFQIAGAGDRRPTTRRRRRRPTTRRRRMTIHRGDRR